MKQAGRALVRSFFVVMATVIVQQRAPAYAGGDPADVGQWLPPHSSPVVAIHSAMLPNGKVLQYSYPTDPPPATGSTAMMWDPQTGLFDDVSLSMSMDIFCSGLCQLADGSIFVTGGNDYGCEGGFQGRFITHRFEPFSGTWTVLGDMSVGRWYPTNITLGDGRVMIFTGIGRDCDTTLVVEMYTPGEGLEVIPEAERWMDLFPRMHLLTSGKIAHVGAEHYTMTYDPATRAWQYIGDNLQGWRSQGTSVLLPGYTDRIMLIGGYVEGVASDTCEIINFANPNPQWQWAASMHNARAHANVVILPNKKVMIVGGGTVDLYGGPVTTPELYDPVANTWTVLPDQVYGRMYHATAVLLPDGRVLSAGQDFGNSAFWSEIYEPAYLFQGPRPVIAGAPNQITYGNEFTISTPDASNIASVALIYLTTVTHSVNTGQRYVDLAFSGRGADNIFAMAPPDGNHAPPGYYMLFLVNNQGVPSVAEIVHLGPPSPPIPTVSQWGVMVMTVCMLIAGAFVFRRMRAGID